MKDSTRNRITKGTFIYVIFYIFLVIYYCMPRILSGFASPNFLSHINENFDFSLNVFSVGLVTICTGFSCMNLGNTDEKTEAQNSFRTFIVILILAFIFFECTLLNMFFGHDQPVITKYSTQVFKGINIDLNTIESALVSTSTVFISGGGVKLAKEKEEE